MWSFGREHFSSRWAGLVVPQSKRNEVRTYALLLLQYTLSLFDSSFERAYLLFELAVFFADLVKVFA
jgi:hypothetical protein